MKATRCTAISLCAKTRCTVHGEHVVRRMQHHIYLLRFDPSMAKLEARSIDAQYAAMQSQSNNACVRTTIDHDAWSWWILIGGQPRHFLCQLAVEWNAIETERAQRDTGTGWHGGRSSISVVGPACPPGRAGPRARRKRESEPRGRRAKQASNKSHRRYRQQHPKLTRAPLSLSLCVCVCLSVPSFFLPASFLPSFLPP